MIDKILSKKNWFLLIAFISGAGVMGIELSASRLIAPYFGSSTFIWANIIGVILVALSFGYYFGGKLADKTHDQKTLYNILIGAGGYSALSPFLIKPLSDFFKYMLVFIGDPFIGIFFGSLLVMLVLFFPAIYLFGYVSPFIITLLTDEYKHPGKVSGDVFAVSTIGSIIGTFLPVLVLIPLIGTSKTILIFSFLIMLLGLLGKGVRYLNLIKIYFVCFLIILLTPSVQARFGEKVAEIETSYNYAQVLDREGFRYLSINEGNSIYTIKNLDGILTGSYFDYYSLLPALDFSNNPQKVLILGLAGGTIADQMIDIYPDKLEVTGVEIDTGIIKAGLEYFQMARPELKIIKDDGRNFLATTHEKFDNIILDAYSNQLYIAFHLTTKEFFESVASKLNDGGVVALNVNAINESSELLTSIIATLNSVFKNVYLMKTGDTLNYMIVATNRELDLNNWSKNLPDILKTYSESLANVKKVSSHKKVLTDDLAPVEYLTDYMILNYER